MIAALHSRRLRARSHLPGPAREWWTGYWTGIALGLVIGTGLAMVLLKGVR